MVLDSFLILTIVGASATLLLQTCRLNATVAVRPVDVPTRLADNGYTAPVTAQHLIDNVRRIQNAATTTMQRSSLIADWTAPDFTVPTTGLSLNALAAYVRRLLGAEGNVIGGDLRYLDSKERVALSVRLNGQRMHAICELNVTGTVEQVLRAGALEILCGIEPYILASYYYAEGDLARVGELLEHILTTRNDADEKVRALNLQGVMLARQRRFSEAMAAYERAISLASGFALAYHNWGNVLRITGDNKGAMGKYEAAVERDPKLTDAYHGWGRTLAAVGQNDGAIEKYREALELDPEFASAYTSWGTALLATAQNERDEKQRELWADAIEKYRKAIELDPGSAVAYSNWGNALRLIGDTGGAIGKHRKAIELAPEFAIGYNNLGNALVAKGDYEEGIEMYERAMDLDPAQFGGLGATIAALQPRIQRP